MLGRIAGKGIPLPVILEYFSLNLAWILALAVPMSVLISTLSAFGRMASDGEITALRASGISPWQLLKPALIASFFVMLWVAWFNNYLLPDMNHRTKLLQIDISRKKPMWKIEPGVYEFDIPNYVLLAEVVDQEEGWLEDVIIYDEHKPGSRSTITAKRARLNFESDEEVMYFILLDGEIHRPSDREPAGYEWTSFDSALFRIVVPGMVLKRGKEGFRGDRELSMGEMLKRIDSIKEKGEGKHNRRRISAYMVEVHKKLSIPAACMVFILVGTPLGILSHKGGFGISGAISLLFFTIYWAFLAAGEKLAERELVSPAVAMWSPNIILAAVGLWILWIARRRTTLPGIGWLVDIVSRIFMSSDKSSKERDT